MTIWYWPHLDRIIEGNRRDGQWMLYSKEGFFRRCHSPARYGLVKIGKI